MGGYVNSQKGRIKNMIDREKVIKGLEHCMIMCEGVPHNPCHGCEYLGSYDCADRLKADALALLKEQPEIVRCKDCVKHNKASCPLSDDYWETMRDDDWFCADGEMKEGE